MPNWQRILEEVQVKGSQFDILRRRYLRRLHRKTGRNAIAYYSGWLQKGPKHDISVSDGDKNGFMNAIHKLDCSKGLDLLLHTPGGDAAATESLVSYLRSKFDTDIRAIIPQIAMSAGTMIACAAKEIVMGKQSSLGPIDPQFNGLPAHGIIEEFDKAIEQAKRDPASIPFWQPIISRYHPTLIGECQKAIKWSNDMVLDWLRTGMFKGKPRAASLAAKAVKALSDHDQTKTHGRHLHIDWCRDNGLNVMALEDDDDLQDLVLSVHHSMMLTFTNTPAVKIIENHRGDALINGVTVQIQIPAHQTLAT